MSKKILVIEDDQDVAMVIATIVRAAGYEVVTAPDAVLALSVARQEKPDLITLDIGMPGGGGAVVLERIRSNTFTSLIPVIVITGSGLVERQEMLDQGAQGYIQKPFEPDELIRAIRGLIGN